MALPPVLSGQEVVRALESFGWSVARQKGSHIILCRDEPFAEVVVPKHKTLDKGTLRAIIRQVELEVDEFIQLLSN